MRHHWTNYELVFHTITFRHQFKSVMRNNQYFSWLLQGRDDRHHSTEWHTHTHTSYNLQQGTILNFPYTKWLFHKITTFRPQVKQRISNSSSPQEQYLLHTLTTLPHLHRKPIWRTVTEDGVTSHNLTQPTGWVKHVPVNLWLRNC